MDIPLGPLPARGRAREGLSPARRTTLDALLELGGRRTVAELAEALGQHPNTVREHLDALVRAGLTERTLRHSAGRGRPAALYRATLAATPAGPEYAVLAEVLIGALARAVPDRRARAAQALAAGHDWGRAIRERELIDRPLPADERRAADTPLTADTPPPADSGLVTDSRPPAVAEDPAALRDSVTRLADMLDRAGFDCRTTPEPDGGYTQRLRRCPVLDLAREHPDIVCTSHLGMARELLAHDGVAAERVTLEAFAEPGACLLRIAPPAADDD
ncbi:Predicted transcriptional regulator, ArsR family [Georgenia satyanarayanai]|uniref:Predicted transcriptional regulator, ArsR family n=1 Tax=Georgenia satyanarayanai TaxID=860221 RepID=A0A2Y9AGV0_9MICO|nr:helix-turn-helix domain-containing protein [Georgenia satyanarayanai]PYF99374.1 putative ArsR family transcriptional regulator [Georgenia satyanarayanai]SSA43186.1 Predicted transcriptional regulator, ArsR family [Georgenia satyanarayanai]